MKPLLASAGTSNNCDLYQLKAVYLDFTLTEFRLLAERPQKFNSVDVDYMLNTTVFL